MTSFLLILYLNVSNIIWFYSFLNILFRPQVAISSQLKSANTLKIMFFTLGNRKRVAIIESQYELSKHACLLSLKCLTSFIFKWSKKNLALIVLALLYMHEIIKIVYDLCSHRLMNWDCFYVILIKNLQLVQYTVTQLLYYILPANGKHCCELHYRNGRKFQPSSSHRSEMSRI